MPPLSLIFYIRVSWICRSNCQKVFYKELCLKILENSQEKTYARASFLIQLQSGRLLHLVDKQSFNVTETIYTSVKQFFRIKSKHQLKNHIYIKTFPIKNADFPPSNFCPLVNVLLTQSVYRPISLVKLSRKCFYIPSNKPISRFVHK